MIPPGSPDQSYPPPHPHLPSMPMPPAVDDADDARYGVVAWDDTIQEEIEIEPPEPHIVHNLPDHTQVLVESATSTDKVAKGTILTPDQNAVIGYTWPRIEEIDISLLKDPETYIILSFDGGGVRGIVPARLVQRIEEKLGAPLSKVVNNISGTSTGALLAIALSQPSPNNPDEPAYKGEDVVSVYQRRAPDIFHSSWSRSVFSAGGTIASKYGSVSIEGVLDDELAESKFHDAVTDLTVLAFDINDNATKAFTHFEGVPPQNFAGITAKEVALYATAAPTYFPSRTLPHEQDPTHTYNFVDGGIANHNPALRAYNEAKHQRQIKQRHVYVISVGTGKSPPDPRYATSLDWGKIQWAPFFIRRITRGNAITTDETMRNMHLRKSRFHYLRVQPQLQEHSQSSMDNTDSRNLQDLLAITDAYFDALMENGFEEQVIEPLRQRLAAGGPQDPPPSAS